MMCKPICQLGLLHLNTPWGLLHSSFSLVPKKYTQVHIRAIEWDVLSWGVIRPPIFMWKHVFYLIWCIPLKDWWRGRLYYPIITCIQPKKWHMRDIVNLTCIWQMHMLCYVPYSLGYLKWPIHCGSSSLEHGSLNLILAVFQAFVVPLHKKLLISSRHHSVYAIVVQQLNVSWLGQLHQYMLGFSHFNMDLTHVDPTDWCHKMLTCFKDKQRIIQNSCQESLYANSTIAKNSSQSSCTRFT